MFMINHQSGSYQTTKLRPLSHKMDKSHLFYVFLVERHYRLVKVKSLKPPRRVCALVIVFVVYKQALLSVLFRKPFAMY